MEKQKLIQLLEEGLSLESIGARVSRSPSTVSYWLKRYGLQANGAARFGRRPPIDPQLLAALNAQGLSVPQMAARLDRSPAVVRRTLARHGLSSRQSRNRRAAAAATSAGHGTVALDCVHHGLTDHVLEGRGSYRCMRCRGLHVAEHRRRVKRTLIAEAGGACVACGYSRCEAALQFHHLEPSEKAFHLSLRGVTRSWTEVRAEAAKCVLLCATCHAEVEAGFTTLCSY